MKNKLINFSPHFAENQTEGPDVRSWFVQQENQVADRMQDVLHHQVHERLQGSQHKKTAALSSSTAVHHVDEDAEPMATVNLPLRVVSMRHSRPLPPPATTRLPGTAVRTASAAASNVLPQAPPRPESTLTCRSRPVITSGPGRPPAPPAVFAVAADDAALLPLTANSESVLSDLRLPLTASVSLTAPRPEPDRAQNLYVDAPRPLLLPQKTAASGGKTAAVFSAVNGGSKKQLLLQLRSSSSFPPTVIISQPQTQTVVTKKRTNQSLSEQQQITATETATAAQQTPSIICQDCGRCRCAACRTPRKLPKTWLCGGTCLCSTAAVVDVLSCMCCVKGLFYHCASNFEDVDADSLEVEAAANPCSCTSPHLVARWGCLAAIVPFLPCLLTYPVLKTAAKATEAVYAKCTASGCRCSPPAAATIQNAAAAAVQNAAAQNGSNLSLSLTSLTEFEKSSSSTESEKRLLD